MFPKGKETTASRGSGAYERGCRGEGRGVCFKELIFLELVTKSPDEDNTFLRYGDNNYPHNPENLSLQRSLGFFLNSYSFLCHFVV
jgi:hypothetical protein